jgi:magnesium transporter
MIRALLYDPTANEQTAGGQELLGRWRDQSQTVLWVDLSDVPPEAETQLLRDWFQLHPLAIQDAQRDRHPPKVETFDDRTFVLLKGLDAQTQDLNFGTIQIAIFVGPRFLVTRHSSVSPSTDRLWQQAIGDPSLLARGADAIAVRLASFVVDRYLPILLALEGRLEELEDEMTARPSDTLLTELVEHRANLKKLRRIVNYHVQVFDQIKTSLPPGIRADLRHEVVDVYEHLERIVSLSGLYYELASDLMDGYITLASHRLNRIVTLLTIVTTVFVPLSFLAGLYGMNFEYMPELRFRYAYFILLGTMALIAGGLLFALSRKGWLSRG